MKEECANNTKRIWCRVGVELEIPLDIYKKIKNGDSSVLKDAIRGKYGRRSLVGDSYVPDIEENGYIPETECYFFDREPL